MVPPSEPSATSDWNLRRPGAEAMATGDGFDRHKADIVPVGSIFQARIAKPDKEKHEAIPKRSRQIPAGVYFFFSPAPLAG